jgi:DNA-binding MarR family transcriptional regulator
VALDFTTEDKIVASIRRLIRAVDLHSRWLVDEYGLTGPQLATLKACAQLGPASATALAKAAHISKPTMTGILDRLEQNELINRTRATEDRRSVMVSLTDRGAKLMEKAPSLLHDRFRNQLSKLEDWEQSSLLSSLQRLAAMMDAEEIEAAPLLVSGPVSATTEEVQRAPDPSADDSTSAGEAK